MYYPIFVDLSGKRCVVVGGGSVARRKVRALLKTEASITLISPFLHPAFKKLINIHKDKIVHHKRRFRLSDIKDAFLVIGATKARDINYRIFSYCKTHNILLNIVDSLSESNFIVPSHIKRGNLILAVSTSGISPGLARKIRKELSAVYGVEYAKLLKALKDIRKDIMKRVTSSINRRIIFNRLINDDIINLAGSVGKKELKKKLLQIIDSPTKNT